MSLLAARDALMEASRKGISPTIEALDDLMDEIEDFFTFVGDYDEWDALYYKGANSPEPGFSLEKLRVQLGLRKGGAE